MPKALGIFDKFSDKLSAISSTDVAARLKVRVDPVYLENFLANRIIYPQSIPLNSQEVLIDLAILTQVLRLDPSVLFNQAKSTIIFDGDFLKRFPLNQLVSASINGLDLPPKTQIYSKDLSGTIPLGTVLTFKDLLNKTLNVKLTQNSTDVRQFIVKNNILTEIECSAKQATLEIEGFQNIQVMGGPMGIILDFRKDQ